MLPTFRRSTIKTCALALCCALMLNACTDYSLRALRKAEMPKDAYLSALAQLYLHYAEAEARAYDWWSSSLFASKGLRIAYGHDTPPERPQQWWLEDQFIPTLQAARSQLVRVQTSDNKRNHPKIVAEAQYFYDCWIEQQVEAWQVEDIRFCRENFYARLSTLERLQPAVAAKASPQITPTPSIKPKARVDHVRERAIQKTPQAAPSVVTRPKPVKKEIKPSPPKKQPSTPAEVSKTSNGYVLYFSSGTPELTNNAKQALATLADTMHTATTTRLIINGHSDNAGSTTSNMDLSLARANFVRSQLIARGIAPSRIDVFAFGDTDPISTNAERNRRVELFLE